MKYFEYLDSSELKRFFLKKPENFNKYSDKELLERALGATLYMPATRENIADEIISKKNPGLLSIVLCLEDAIGDAEVEKAEDNLVRNLKKIHKHSLKHKKYIEKDLPLIFIRVRSPEHILKLYEKLGDATRVLTGFSLPKVKPENVVEYFENINRINEELKDCLYGMPILESSDIIYKELREKNLTKLKEKFDRYTDLILNVRIGATDFSNIYGIRRNFNTTIYDIVVIRDCIADIINKFVRVEKEYVVSGPVWEYFSNKQARVLKPKLRETPFKDSYGESGIKMRKKILKNYTDGLLEEVLLDKANGLCGKTIIHPSHILPVQAMYAVSHEEYLDACHIIEKATGEIGVMKSKYSNKMNEVKTHINWARKIIKMSKIYGVLNEDEEFARLLYV